MFETRFNEGKNIIEKNIKYVSACVCATSTVAVMQLNVSAKTYSQSSYVIILYVKEQS